MKLLILRHGPAGDKTKWKGPDAERPLEKPERTRKAVKGLVSLEPAVKVIATSPLLRALQTSAYLEKAYPKAKRVVAPELSPESPPQYALDLAARLGDGAAFVGHEPHLSELIKLATGGAVELKKAGAALLEFEGSAAPGRGRVLWLAVPSLLRRLV